MLGGKTRRMLRDTGQVGVDRNGWFGPVGSAAPQWRCPVPQREVVEPLSASSGIVLDEGYAAG